MLRRAFLQTLPAAAAAMTAAAAEESPVKLGFDTYSLRAFKWKGTQLLDYAAGLKLDTIQFSALADYGPLDPQNLQKVKSRAQELGISIDSGMGCICESAKAFNKNGPPARQQLLEGLKVTRAVGSKSMRCYMGASDDRLGPLPIEAHMENTIKVFRSVRAEAMDLGVKIALENHSGDLQAREVKTIIEESGSDFVAACLDTGNPIWCVEDPFVTLETLAPYVVTTHVRDSVVFEDARGAAGQWVALETAMWIWCGSYANSAGCVRNRRCNSRSSRAVRRVRFRIWNPIFGRHFRKCRPGNSRASCRWPRAGIPSWGRW